MPLASTWIREYECQTNRLQYGKWPNLPKSLFLDSQRNLPHKTAGVEMTQEDLPCNISPHLASTTISLPFQGCVLPSITGALADADSRHRKLLTVS